MGHCKTIALPPQYYNLGPLYAWAPHLLACNLMPRRRHLGIRMNLRGSATRLCHINATQAFAWVRVALPRGLACHVISVQVPRRATSGRGSCRKNNLFLPFFLKRIKSKINSKKSKKFINQYLQNITPF